MFVSFVRFDSINVCFFCLSVCRFILLVLFMHWHFEQIKKGSINSVHLLIVILTSPCAQLCFSLSFSLHTVQSPNLTFHFLLMTFFCEFSTLFLFLLLLISFSILSIYSVFFSVVDIHSDRTVCVRCFYLSSSSSLSD